MVIMTTRFRLFYRSPEARPLFFILIPIRYQSVTPNLKNKKSVSMAYVFIIYPFVSLFWQLGRAIVITIKLVEGWPYRDSSVICQLFWETKRTRPDVAAMAILFLLFLVHATLTSATQLTKRQSDYYSAANSDLSGVLVLPILDQNQSVVINQSTDPEIRLAAHDSHAEGNEHHHGHGIHVASWRWDEIGIYITFTTFIIVAGLAKVGNNSSPCSDCFVTFYYYNKRKNFCSISIRYFSL